MRRPWLMAVVLISAALLCWLAVTSPLQPSASATVEPAEPEDTPAAPAAAPSPPMAAVEPGADEAPPPAAPAEPSAPPASADPESPNAPLYLPTPPDDQGPVAERRERFGREPRDSAAVEAEESLRGVFRHPSVSPSLLESILCRQTICKAVVRLSPERMSGYIAAMTLASTIFDPELAVAPSREVDANQVRQVEVYLLRRPKTD